jgi:transcriptional regulator with XRE-family HTH domain
MSFQVQIAIRTRKLGVLIRDARLADRRTIPETAKAIGITATQLRAYEEGAHAPSLPELEVLAYYLDLPVQHFWGSDARSEIGSRIELLDLTKLAAVRQRIIGTLLRQKRLQADRSLKALAAETGLSIARIKAYELGERPIPVPELDVILQVLGGQLETFFSQAGPIGTWMSEQALIDEFMDLPPDLRAFVCMPINRPYLELAKNLSQMPTDKLRAIAEGLLDITL